MATEHDTRNMPGGSTAALGAMLTDDQADESPRLPRQQQFETEYQNPRDILNMRLAQAGSLSHLLYGGGLESFLEMADGHKDNILWALSSLIEDAQVAASRLPRGVA